MEKLKHIKLEAMQLTEDQKQIRTSEFQHVNKSYRITPREVLQLRLINTVYRSRIKGRDLKRRGGYLKGELNLGFTLYRKYPQFALDLCL